MDRGRAGGFVTDNNYFGTRLKEKQLREHKLRLEKIMRRKPGTSVTLDNAPPQVMRGSVVLNPRKEALKEHLNQVTEKENKSLLKRISLILTAPPKITDKDYLEMKKLCKSQKNGQCSPPSILSPLILSCGRSSRAIRTRSPATESGVFLPPFASHRLLL